jgi:cell wall-associated NlpC family hydrolase
MGASSSSIPPLRASRDDSHSLVATIARSRVNDYGVGGLAGGAFREFCICCRLGTYEWHVWRRYSQFAALRSELRHVIAAQNPLPAKGFFKRHETSDAAAAARVPALSAWIAAVVADDAAIASPHLLAFIGAASLETRSRAALHVRAIASTAESGDLVLFRTKATVPAIQRAVTQSHWDHVGILLFLDRNQHVCAASQCAHRPALSGGQAGVLECDAAGAPAVSITSPCAFHRNLSDLTFLLSLDTLGPNLVANICVARVPVFAGTRFYPLSSYEAVWHHQYDAIALRPLQWSGRGTPATTALLQRWYTDVLGAPYELTFKKIFRSAHGGGQSSLSSSRAASVGEGGASSIGSCSDGPVQGSTVLGEQPKAATMAWTSSSGDNSGFFCSELVAHCYQALGVLPTERPASGFWPVDFGEAARNRLRLSDGASFGDEIPIEFATPAVGCWRVPS